MKLRNLVLAAAAVLFCSFGVAHADTYQVTYTGTGVAGAFTLGTTGTTVTSLIGTVDGSSIANLLPGQDGGDQQFSPTFPEFSFSGLSFGLANGQHINLFSDGTTNVEENFTSGAVRTPIDVNVAVAATPEPSSLMLLGSGLLGTLGMARRRFVNA